MTDAIAELEQQATRLRSEEDAAQAYSAAITRLLRGKVNAQQRDMPSCAFFATLALRLKREPNWDIPTAAADGKTLFYNPTYWNDLSPDERVGVLAHEVMHCSNRHHVRRKGRDVGQWNIACDLAINPLLRDSGFQLPHGVLYPDKYNLADGLSAEEYYRDLPDRPDFLPMQGDDPGGCGGVIDGAADESQRRQQETEWEVATAQAAQAAKQRGALSGGLERFVEAVTAPKVDWHAELREFVNSHAKNDYSWIPPNRRFIHQGLYLPSLHSDELGDVAVACDCSGSIGESDLAEFASEIEEIASVASCSVTVLYHDSSVCHVQHWTPTDGPLKLQPHGGGGTDHRPVFDWLSQHEPPTCAIMLTDLESVFPNDAPPYPVLWATKSKHRQAPFGRTVRVA